MIHVKHLQRRWLFATLDIVGVFVTCCLALYIRYNVPLPVFEGLLPPKAHLSYTNILSPVAVLAVFYIFIQYILGVYDLWATSSPFAWAQRLLPPNVMLIACAFAYLYVSKQFDFPRSVLVTAGFVNFIYGLAWRRIYFRGVEKAESHVLLVGSIEQCERVAAEFDLPPFQGRVFVKAIFATNATSPSVKFPTYNIADFEGYSREHPYTSVIVVPSDLGYDNTFGEVLSAAKRGIPVYAMPSAYEILLGRLRHVQVNDLPLLELKLEPPSAFFSLCKRVLDFSLGLLLIFALSPLLACIALLVRVTSRGPALYFQDRVGLQGRLFRVYKFRSMVQDAEGATGPVFATKRDPRITWLGNFMRQTRLDELPQLFNIINGDMSFVGPRPERPTFVEKFEREIPGYKERTRIRPGVTGLAQVSGSYESSAEIKLKYDLAYLANQSLVLDIQILMKTAKTVLLRAGQ